ncbi:MAG: hypothetical protein M1821_001316 [Bathelium mastoideum]|nr:MAG: hypothetical protein M1821_001316 [Bathelium mastoideum]
MHAKSPLTCHVFSFKADLNIITDPLPKGAELGITLDYTGKIENISQCTLRSRTRFFEDEAVLKFVRDGELTDAVTGLVEYDGDDSLVLGNVSFGSTFWARRLHELAQTLRSQHRLPTPRDDCSEDSKDAISSHVQTRNTSEHVDTALRRLCAVQEIFAYPQNSSEPVQLVLVSTWHFTKSRNGEQAASTWQRLHPPKQHRCPDDPGFPSGLLSPQQEWDAATEVIARLDRAIDNLQVQAPPPPPPPPPILRSPIELAEFEGLQGFFNFQAPLAAMDNLPYPNLPITATDAYNYDFPTTPSGAHHLDPVIAAACAGLPTDAHVANAVDFDGGHIALSFDAGDSSGAGFAPVVSSVDHNGVQPDDFHSAFPPLTAPGALPSYADVNADDNADADTTAHTTDGMDDVVAASLALDVGPLEAIADTDLAAPCPVPFTSEQMQEYARRWGNEFNHESVYGGDAMVEGSCCGEFGSAGAGQEQAEIDIGAETADGRVKKFEVDEER